MGIWDEYCTVCGGPPYALFDTMEEDAEQGEPVPLPPPNPADYTWLESIIGISNMEELIPLTNYDEYGRFDIQLQPDDNTASPYTFFSVGCREDDDDIDGIAAGGYACHATCYNLLQQELNYTLKYADVLPLLVDNEYNFNKFSWSDYGGLMEYQEQCFNALQLVMDGKLWMVEDPTRNEQNKERILKLWKPLVQSGFKRPDGRAGDHWRSAQEVAVANRDESSA